MNDSNQSSATAPQKQVNQPLNRPIRQINASLENYTVVAQDLENWLIYCDGNGQLVGWITKTTAGDYTAVRLRSGLSNNFEVFFKLDSYQKTVDFILEGE